MNNFKAAGAKKRGSGFEGRVKSGGHRGSDSRSGGHKSHDRAASKRPIDLHKATCSTCDKDCMLPFRPNTDKPVFCSDCFSKNSKSGDRGVSKPPRSERSPRHDRPSPQDLELKSIKAQLKTIEDRLNRVLDIINPPVPAKKSGAKAE